MRSVVVARCLVQEQQQQQLCSLALGGSIGANTFTHTDAEKIPAKVAHPDRSGPIRGQMLWKHDRKCNQ